MCHFLTEQKFFAVTSPANVSIHLKEQYSATHVSCCKSGFHFFFVFNPTVLKRVETQWSFGYAEWNTFSHVYTFTVTKQIKAHPNLWFEP